DIDLINHSNEIIKVIEEIKLKEFELPLYKKGFLITRNENFINTFDTLIKKTNLDIKELKDLTIDNPAQQDLIKLLDSVTLKNIEIISSSAMEFPENNSSQKNIDATIEIQKNLYQIDDITNKLESNEFSILKSRNAEAERTNSSTQLFIIITGVFSFIVIGLSLFISDKLISARNRTEKQLSDSYGELEGRVEERTQALTESNKKLSEGIIIRGKIEDTLRESEERFRMMADSVPVMIWITDKNKQYTYINKIFLKFTGRSIEQELGKGWTEGIHVDDLKNYINTFETSFEKREPYEIEYRLKNSKGEYIWIYDNGIPRFEGNNFVGFIGNCIDINERKRSEKYLNIQYEVSKTLIESENLKKASTELLCNICEGINWDFGIMWVADEKNEFIDEVSNWNNDKNNSVEYSKLSDVKNKFEKGVGITGAVFAEGKTKWFRDLSSEKGFLRIKVAQKMGWVSGIEIPISNGKDTIAIIECFSKIMVEENKDIIEVVESAGRQIGNYIERKRVEENLKRTYEQLDNKILERTSELASALTKIINESEEKERIQNRIKIFAHAIRSIKDSIFICDLDNKIIFVNKAFEETYGYMEDEILGFEIPILDNMKITEDFKKDILSKSIKEGWRGELHTQRKDGYSFITYLSTSSIKNEEWKTNAWAGICQDITDLKNSEEELKRINIKLLESQKEVIHNEKLAALGRFSSGVAHEIRNPLANISSLAQLISKASIDEKNKRRLKYIITNVEIANIIIKNLLYFASPEEPEYDFNNLNL
ncbi:MAG: PAS domain S-box protein, partial [Ignavibacteria bacterium]|nr:PAS domain S-box protein [Ignavibacteria bacterium]